MTDFIVHTPETAKADAADMLGGAQKKVGFIPNLYGVMAESPAVLKAYLDIGQTFDESSFTPTERQVVLLAINRYHECHYCMAAHSVIAGMQKVPADVIESLRNDTPIADPKLETLRRFATAMVDKRGWVDEDDIAAFTAAGYGRQQMLEVVLGAAMKTLSNYVNHLGDTPVDAAFSAQSWTPPANS